MRAPGEPVRPGGSRLAVTLGLAYLVVAAMGRLAYATPHLLGDVAPWSAVDLKYRFNEVAVWFSGQPVYGVVDGAVYPPASHAILWPLLGWLSLPAARLFWLLTTLGAATLIAVVAWRAAAGTPTRERWLLCGLAYAAYPLQLSVFVGQMGMHVTAAAMGGALLLFTLPTRRGTDLLGALITGITGQDGSYLAELLVGKGYEVHGVIRRASQFNTDRIDHLYQDPHDRRARPLCSCTTATCPTAPCCAAYSRPSSPTRSTTSAPSRTSAYRSTAGVHRRCRAVGTLRLLEAIRDYARRIDEDVRFYQAGSSEMFGSAAAPQSESTPFYPRSPYAVSQGGGPLARG
jgi:hypothetical protein